MEKSQGKFSNKLLRCLSPKVFANLISHLTPVDLAQGQELALPNAIPEMVVFPETGVASVIGNTDGMWQELGLFGLEGAACLSSLLTPCPSSNLTVIQVAGNGHQIAVRVLQAASDRSDELRELVLAYFLTFNAQVSHTAIANVQCNAVQRLARWLLMIQDRMGSDRFSITHDYIAAMLGVARTSVTLSLLQLEKEELISTGRRLIRINKRPQLAALAARYYGRPEEEYSRIMDARIHRYQQPAG